MIKQNHGLVQKEKFLRSWIGLEEKIALFGNFASCPRIIKCDTSEVLSVKHCQSDNKRQFYYKKLLCLERFFKSISIVYCIFFQISYNN